MPQNQDKTRTVITVLDERVGLPYSAQLQAGANITLIPGPGSLTIAAAGALALTQEFLTGQPEPTLVNSRELLAGTGVAFDDTTPGQRLITATGMLGVLKLVDTARNSTIVPANDPELVFPVVPAGLYQFSLGLLTSCSAGSGGGIRWTLAFSSPPVGEQNISVFQTLAAPGLAATSFLGGTLRTYASPVLSTEPATASFRSQTALGIFLLPAISSVSFSWAQNTSVLVDTIVQAGSAMSLIRVA